MQIRLCRWGRFPLGSVLLALLMLGAGCKTTTKSLFTVSGPGWQIQQGQALWRPRGDLPELAGDLVFARDAQARCFVTFAKTPMSLVSAQVTSNRWRIEFPPKGWSFSGHGTGPTRFLFLHLGRALDGQPIAKPLRFARKPDEGWRLENLRTGESLEGFLSP